MGDAPPDRPHSVDRALRWIRWLGVAVIAVVAALTIGQTPAPGLAGRGLGVTLSLAVLLASAGVALGRTAPGGLRAALAAMILSSAGLVWLQGAGAGAAVLFVAVAVAAMRLNDPWSLATVSFAAIAFLPPAVHVHRSLAAIVANELGIVAFYLVARSARSASEAHEETRRLLIELEASRDAEAEAAMLRERSRLARDMHDVLAHSLSGLMLQLEGARILSTQPDANGRLSPALDRAHHLARSGLEEARRAIAALRDDDPPGADRLEQLTADFERDSRVPVRLEIAGVPRRLDSDASLTLYRVAQEALTNSLKHARADRIELRLSYETSGTRLTVSDHGPTPANPAAAEAAAAGGGYGLTGMRERAELLGGRLEAAPTSDGFRVELWIPA
jgi:signal transduction histidine kinase